MKQANYNVQVVNTNQQEITKNFLKAFSIKTDFDLSVVNHGLSPAEYFIKMYSAIDLFVKTQDVHFVFVHGDTTTAFATALACFLNGIRFAHVEAGLRTFDLSNPFPEEGFRVVIDDLATLKFAPTDISVAQICNKENCFVTGNTGIDSLRIANNMFRDKHPYPEKFVEEKYGLSTGYILVTLHRRESFGDYHQRIFDNIKSNPQFNYVVQVHPNPGVAIPLRQSLSNLKNVMLIEPQPYLDFIGLMVCAAAILTDSGGIQEEATAMNVPLLIARENTERPEVLTKNNSFIVGDSAEKLHKALKELEVSIDLTQRTFRPCPVGDGYAAHRIVNIFENFDCYRDSNIQNGR